MEITFQPIGVIHTPFTALSDMPIQPGGKASALGTVELSPEFMEGLKDLDGFSHVILIYYLHKVSRKALTVTPFLDFRIAWCLCNAGPDPAEPNRPFSGPIAQN